MKSRFWVGVIGDDGSNTVVPDDDEGLTKAEATGRRLKLIQMIPKEKVVLIAVYEEECTSQKKTESNIILQ